MTTAKPPKPRSGLPQWMTDSPWHQALAAYREHRPELSGREQNNRRSAVTGRVPIPTVVAGIPMFAVTGEPSSGVSTIATTLANHFAGQMTLVPCARVILKNHSAGLDLLQRQQATPSDNRLKLCLQYTLFRLQVELEALMQAAAQQASHRSLICDGGTLDYMEGLDGLGNWESLLATSIHLQAGRYGLGSLFLESARSNHTLPCEARRKRWTKLAQPPAQTLPFMSPTSGGVQRRQYRAIEMANAMFRAYGQR